MVPRMMHEPNTPATARTEPVEVRSFTSEIRLDRHPHGFRPYRDLPSGQRHRDLAMAPPHRHAAIPIMCSPGRSREADILQQRALAFAARRQEITIALDHD